MRRTQIECAAVVYLLTAFIRLHAVLGGSLRNKCIGDKPKARVTKLQSNPRPFIRCLDIGSAIPQVVDITKIVYKTVNIPRQIPNDSLNRMS